MQDQPRYEVYEGSKFFADGQASRPYIEGTVPRGYLRDDVAFYQGRRAAGTQAATVSGGGGGAGALVGSQQSGQGASAGEQNVLQTDSPNAQAASAGATQPGGDVNVRGNVGGNVGQQVGETQGAGRSDLVNEFPFPITAADLNRGQERYQIYCAICHGATGFGDGMIVRRGFRRPPSFHDDRLRGEPLGHFFDVITNGWGAMASYADLVPPDDRWRIIAYLRALQLSRQSAGAQPPPTQQQQPQQNAPSPEAGSPRPGSTPTQPGSGGANRR